ncbi:MAG: outer membrane beta-barrel protein [Bradymonadia bacterium]
MKLTTLITTSCVAFGLLLAAGQAQAKKARKHEFGIGAMGLVNGSFIGEPSEEEKAYENAQLPYPGFAGVGGGGGLSFAYMYRGAIGLELDLLYMAERGTGTYDFGALDVDVTLSQSSIHIPLMVKAAIPYRTTRPFLMVGPEFVIPVSSEVDAGSITDLKSASADFYTALGFGLGMDIILPVSDADIRIPIAFRGNWTPGFSRKVTDRYPTVDLEGNTARIREISTEWEFQAFFTIGVAYHFK